MGEDRGEFEARFLKQKTSGKMHGKLTSKEVCRYTLVMFSNCSIILIIMICAVRFWKNNGPVDKRGKETKQL